jgi:DNA-binding response OmpR family regulator
VGRSGYGVDNAEDGAAGWEVLHANHFDLLITGHHMPRMSGLELVMKARSARMTLPIILATGALPEEELERHPWLQLATTLLKPFTPGQLLETVKRVLRAADVASLGREICFPLRGDALGQSAPYQDSGTNGRASPG